MNTEFEKFVVYNFSDINFLDTECSNTSSINEPE